MGSRRCRKRSLVRVSTQAKVKLSHQVDYFVGQPKGSSSPTRNTRVNPKTGDRTGRPPLRRLLFDFLRRPQKGRRISTSSKSSSIEQVYQISKVQNGDKYVSTLLPDTGGLVSEHRSSGRLPSHSHSSCTQAIPSFCISRQGLPISGSTLWPDLGSEGVYADPQSSSAATSQSRNHFHSVSRRLSDSRKNTKGSSKGCVYCDPNPSRSGFSDKSEKISFDSQSRSCISGNETEFGIGHGSSAYRKSPNRESVRKNLLHEFNKVSTNLPETSRTDGFMPISSSIRPSEDEAFSDLLSVKMGRPISVVTRGNFDSSLSASISGNLERRDQAVLGSSVSRNDSFSNHHHRRIACRVGRSLPKTSSSRKVEGRSKDAPHQLLRAVGSTQDTQIIRSLAERSQSPRHDGQHFSTPIHKQNGRDKITISMCSNNEDVSMVHGPQNNITGSARARSPEHISGQAISEVRIQHGMVSEKTGCLRTVQSLGRPIHRSIRFKRKQTLSNLLLVAARYKRLARRRIKLQLARHVRLRIPTDSTNSEGSVESASRQGGDDSNCTMLAGQVVVSHATQTIDRQSGSPSASPRLANSMQRDSAPSRSGRLVPGSLEDKSRFLQTEGLSRGVAETILAARAPSTYAKYESGWKDFYAWSTERSIDPIRSTVSQVLDYLQDCAKTRNLSCSTVRSRLYAISLNHKDLPLEKLSGHPWVKSFLKGIARLYPSIKNRHPTWNLQLVLQSLRGHPFEPLQPGRLKMMTYKVALLLAITTAKRVGELKALSVDHRYLIIDQTGIRLRLNPAFIPKVNTQQNREKEVFFTPFCPRNNTASTCTLYTLCVQRAVSRYVQATKPFRQTDQLFVCFAGAKKGKAATKTTISRWVRTAIQEAYTARGQEPPQGIKAHDTRGMAASWAQFNNASLADICDTASWSNQCTFATHYQLNLAGNRPSARFGNAVLQTVLDRRPQ